MNSFSRNVPPAQIQTKRDPLDAIFLYLLVCLTLVLLVTGVMSAWFFKRVDSDYSKLMAETTTDLRSIHDIAFNASLTYTQVLELLLERDRQKKEELVTGISKQRAANDKLFDQLDHSIARRSLRPRLEEMKLKRLSYWNEYKTLITSTREEREMDVQAPEWRRITAAFISYQKSCEKLASQIERKSLQKTRDTATGVAKLRLLFFGLAILPIGLAILLALAVLYLIWVTPTEVEFRDTNELSSASNLTVFPGEAFAAGESPMPKDSNLSI